MSDIRNDKTGVPTPSGAGSPPAQDMTHGANVPAVVPVQQQTPSKIANANTAAKVAQVMHDIGGITPDKH